MTVRQHLLNMFTGKDNQTLDMGRIVWFKGCVIYSVCAMYMVYKTHTFDFVAFGTGFGLVLAAGGVALMAKSGTEPEVGTRNFEMEKVKVTGSDGPH